MNATDFQTGQIKAIDCYKEGWELIKDDYWLLFAVALVGALIGGMSMYIVLGAMVCGIFICYLQKIDTGKVEFENLWKGFEFFGQSLIVTLVIFVPTIIIYAIIYLPILIAAVVGQNVDSGTLLAMLAGGLIFDLILIVLMVCFHTLMMFSFPLIADRRLPAFESMKTSAKAVWNNLGGVAALFGIQFVAMIVVGLLTCGLGMYFLMPIMIAGMAVAYRKVFPAAGQANPGPPPPYAFQDAGEIR